MRFDFIHFQRYGGPDGDITDTPQLTEKKDERSLLPSSLRHYLTRGPQYLHGVFRLTNEKEGKIELFQDSFHDQPFASIIIPELATGDSTALRGLIELSKYQPVEGKTVCAKFTRPKESGSGSRAGTFEIFIG